MEGPNDDFRMYIAQLIDGLAETDEPQDALTNILAQIEEAAGADEAADIDTEDDAYRELGAIDAWAGLASDAVQALYERHSLNPMNAFRAKKGQPKIAGYPTPNPEWLRRIAGKLEPKLHAVARALRGVGFGIAVGFPGGISISVSYTVTP